MVHTRIKSLACKRGACWSITLTEPSADAFHSSRERFSAHFAGLPQTGVKGGFHMWKSRRSEYLICG